MALRLDWSVVSTPDRPSERSAHDLAADPSGALILFGGMAADDKGDPIPYADAWRLTDLDGEPMWKLLSPKGDVPCKREGHTLTFCPSLSAFVLFGGSDDEQEKEFNDLHILDASGVWKSVQTTGMAPAPRLNHAADVVGQDLYVFGGFQDGEAKNDLYKLDLETMKWTVIKVANAPDRRCNHSLTAVGNKLYVFGGRGGEKLLFNDVHCFDAETRQWTVIEPSGTPPPPRDFHSAVTFDDKIVIFGGAMEIESQDIFKYYNDVVIYDTTRNAWVRPPISGTPPSVRWAHAAAMFNNKMVVFGGTANDVDLNDTHILTIIDSGLKPAPRRKPSVTRPAAPIAPSTPKPRPTPTPQDVEFERTAAPSISYDVPNPAPAIRRRVTPKVITDVAPRDFDRMQSQMMQSIEDLFRKIAGEYQQIDRLRAELMSDREAFEKEKCENEELFENQQQSMRHLQEKHRQETEEWLASRKSENDDERRKIAEEWVRVKAEEQRIKDIEEKLSADRAALEAEKTAFETRRKKMEAIMAQFENLNG
eukprot:m.202333 g.202333  ORF g.202333 m.202333 type:complete len:535 (+) comp16872_c11_seq2:227-1831(+)